MELQKYKNDFEKKGLCIIRKFIKENTLRQIKKFSTEIKKKKPKKNQIMKYYEKSVLDKKKEILVRAEYFHDFHSGFRKFLNSNKIHKILNFLMNGKCILFKEKINFKLSGCRADKLHQDSQGGWNKFSKNFISILVSIDKSTKENGCLEFDISGHNKDKEIGKIFSPLKIQKLNKPKFRKVELNPGDVVFFNHYIPHRSKSNKSNLSRCQLYITYNLKKDGNFRKKYFKEKRASYPPNNERAQGSKLKYKI
jgi:ectoine hydroxylase-related dioxygenase (phytanoyl-CoA dioxygenase family)